MTITRDLRAFLAVLATMLLALIAGVVLILLLASTPAAAEDGWSVPDYGPDPTRDILTGCDWATAPDCSVDGGGTVEDPTGNGASPVENQYDSGASAPTSPVPAPTSPDEVQVEELPDTGGSEGGVPLALGLGVLLVAGGFLARRLTK
jgi:LPXTG-motif cell wall-anchored protein